MKIFRRQQSIPMVGKIGQLQHGVSHALPRNVANAVTMARQAKFAGGGANGIAQRRNCCRPPIAKVIIETGEVMKGHEKERHRHQHRKHTPPTLPKVRNTCRADKDVRMP
jgi:hypothetical protein